MVYGFGICGFACGFLAGLMIINIYLKSYSSNDLVRDKSLRWTYGLAVWIMGGLGAGLGVWLYNRSVF